MSLIDIRRPHNTSRAAAKVAVERVAEGIAKEYGVIHAWNGDCLDFKRSGVHGHIVVGAKDLHVRVNLGFLMSAMKPVIEREIGRQLDMHLA